MRVKKMMAGKLSCHHQPSPESLKFLIMFGLARLISRSSTCSDNDRERGKFWRDTKLQARKPN